MILIRNDRGREFAVVFVDAEPGSDFGPKVRFYDRTHRHKGTTPVEPGGIDPELGQGCGSYYVDTILGEDRFSQGMQGLGETGLCLHGGVPEWTIDAATMRIVIAYLRGRRSL